MSGSHAPGAARHTRASVLRPYGTLGRTPACWRATPGTATATRFASRLVMAGVDLLSIQKLGGWRTLSMVQRYAHLVPGSPSNGGREADRRRTGVNLDSTTSADTARVS